MAKCGIDGDLIRLNGCVSPVAGTKDLAYIGDLNDIIGWEKQTSPALSSDYSKVYKSPVMKFTKRFYKIEGKNNSIQAMNNMDGTGMFPKYSHGLNFSVLDISPKIVKQLQKLNNSKFVAVVDTKNGEYLVQGRNGGLVNQTNNADSSSQDTGGTFQIEALSTEEKEYADYLQVYTGTSPNFVKDDIASYDNFNALGESQPFDITAISVGTTTTITLDTAINPYVLEAEVGTLVTFAGIVGTVGTDVDGLNGKTFAIASVVSNNVFTITHDTTGLVYTSGGTAK
jgi:hypothetical protein